MKKTYIHPFIRIATMDKQHLMAGSYTGEARIGPMSDVIAKKVEPIEDISDLGEEEEEDNRWTHSARSTKGIWDDDLSGAE